MVKVFTCPITVEIRYSDDEETMARFRKFALAIAEVLPLKDEVPDEKKSKRKQRTDTETSGGSGVPAESCVERWILADYHGDCETPGGVADESPHAGGRSASEGRDQ